MSSFSKARQRIFTLLDDNSFVEIGAKIKARATSFNQDPVKMASDGVITGYGLIDGALVYVYSQDASVLGGSIGEMHAKKITASAFWNPPDSVCRKAWMRSMLSARSTQDRLRPPD